MSKTTRNHIAIQFYNTILTEIVIFPAQYRCILPPSTVVSSGIQSQSAANSSPIIPPILCLSNRNDACPFAKCDWWLRWFYGYVCVDAHEGELVAAVFGSKNSKPSILMTSPSQEIEFEERSTWISFCRRKSPPRMTSNLQALASMSRAVCGEANFRVGWSCGRNIPVIVTERSVSKAPKDVRTTTCSWRDGKMKGSASNGRQRACISMPVLWQRSNKASGAQ